jgi:hypothetical protein
MNKIIATNINITHTRLATNNNMKVAKLDFML